jgi:DNA-binding FadR family transcriptional regulator
VAAPTNAREVHVPKTAELVATRVRREIMLGLLKEGDPLPPENRLMAEFRVSRPTLREAYRILESEGLLSIRRGAGGRIQAPSVAAAARYAGYVLQFRGTSLGEIYEARTMLEAPCAGLAARRRTEKDLTRLRRLVRDAEASLGDLTGVLAVHHEFHAEVVELGRNRSASLLATMLNGILDQADVQHVASRCGSAEEVRSTEMAHRTHVRLLELIEAKDADGAERLWRTHLEEAAKHVLRSLGATTVVEVLA